MQKFIFAALFFLFHFTLYSFSGDTITLGDDIKFIQLSKHIRIYEDKNRDSSSKEVASDAMDRLFIGYKDDIPCPGYKNSLFWIKFDLLNSSSETKEVILEYNGVDYGIKTDIFIKEGSSLKRLANAGELPLDDYKGTAFYIRSLPHQKTTYFIKFKVNGFLKFDLSLSEPAEFIKRNRSDHFVLGIETGIILIMILYNLFLFFSIRRVAFIYFIFFILGFAFYKSHDFKYFYDLLPFLERFDTKIFFFQPLIQATAFFLFGSNFLISHKYAPKLRYLIIGLISLLFLSGLLYIFSDLTIFYNIRDVLLIAGGATIMILALISLLKGYKAARYFITASVVAIFVSILGALTPFNIFPDLFIIKYWSDIASISIISLFSIALADMINIIRREKESAQQLAISNLHKADKLKEEFLANTTHELKTPLHGMIGITESLLSGTAGKTNKVTEQNLSLVVQSGKRLLTLINEILDFSKLRHSDLLLDKKTIDIKSIAGIVIKISAALVQNKKLVLHNDLKDNLPLVYADENRLYQILYNLVGNAIKFTPSGKISITGKESNGFVEISIEDTGIGIAADKIDTIFNTFEQGDGSISREYGGTGLGLSITKQLVELHGGRIWVKSTEKKGSVFTFTLPISTETPVQYEIDNPAIDMIAYDNVSSTVNNIPGSKESSILVVDDEPVNIQVIENQLSGLNLNIYKAYDGIQALEIIETVENIDIILLDVMMPRLSGYEVCLKIREKYTLFEKPVLMLTVKNQIGDLVAGFESGANDYLTKPFNRTELINRVKTLLKLKNTTSANELLKRVNNLKTELMSIAAHDLKNPLTVILSYSQFVKKRLKEDTSEYNYIQKIYDSSSKMNHLITELLESEQIEFGNIYIKKEPVEITGLVKKTIDNFKILTKEKSQKIIFRCKLNEVIIKADIMRLQEILDNLISNAVKYSPFHKNIYIIVEKKIKNSVEYVSIHVKDEGPGFSDEDKTKIFGKFQKLSARPTGNESSVGLGLSITKELIELHSGEISVESKKGKGAVFIVDLPV